MVAPDARYRSQPNEKRNSDAESLVFALDL